MRAGPRAVERASAEPPSVEPVCAEPGSVLRDRDFLALLGSRAASTVATAATWVLLPVHVYETSGSAVLAGLMSAANVVPFLLFGLLAGAMADRTSPRSLMVLVEAANAVVLLTVPLLVLTGSLSVGASFAVGFLSATLFVWFDVSSAAALPAVVGRGRVFQANGHLWSVQTLVTASAAPLGYLLADRRGLGGAFTVLAVFATVSAVLAGRVRTQRPVPLTSTARPPAAPPPLDARTTRSSRFSAVGEGFRFIAREPTVRMLTLVALGSGLSGGAVYGMLVVFADRSLGLDPTDPRVAWLLAACGLGALGASVLAPRLRGVAVGRVVVAALAADVVLMTAYGLSTAWTAALVTVLAWNLVHTTLMIVSISVRQVLAPPALQGRVNAAGRMIAWGSVPAGAAVCGALTDATASSATATLVLVVPVAVSLVTALVLVPRLSGTGAPAPGAAERATTHPTPAGPTP